MKNKLWSLFCSQLNVHYGWSAAKHLYFKERRRVWEPLLIGVFLLPLGLAGIKFLWAATEQLFIAGLGLGQPHLALVYGAVLVSVLTFFFGFFSVLSAFYFSSDLEILLSFPLEPWEILSVKLGVILAGQYVINLIVLAPIWLKYGMLAEAGFAYLLSAFLVFLLLPLIPLLLVGFVTVVLMRLINLSRHKDKLTFIGGLIVVILSLAFQFWVYGRLGSEDPNVLLERIVSEADGLVHIVGRIFPSAAWAAQAMAYAHRAKGWLNLVYFALASALGLLLLYLLGERVFMRGVLQGLEGSRGGRREKVSQRDIREHSALSALVRTEIRLFARNPNYALNGLVGYIMVPVLVGLSIFSSNIPNNPFEFLASREFPPMLLLGGITLFFLAMVSMAMIASTTFSREGKHLWIMRSLPVTIGQVVSARALAAGIVNLLGCLLGLLPGAFLLGWRLRIILPGAGIGVLLAGGWSYLLILWDLRRPMLDWVNPAKALKSNWNAAIGLVGSGVLLVVLWFLISAIFRSGHLWAIPAVLALAAGIMGAAAFYFLRGFAGAIWSQMEEGS